MGGFLRWDFAMGVVVAGGLGLYVRNPARLVQTVVVVVVVVAAAVGHWTDG